MCLGPLHVPPLGTPLHTKWSMQPGVSVICDPLSCTRGAHSVGDLDTSLHLSPEYCCDIELVVLGYDRPASAASASISHGISSQGTDYRVGQIPGAQRAERALDLGSRAIRRIMGGRGPTKEAGHHCNTHRILSQ